RRTSFRDYVLLFDMKTLDDAFNAAKNAYPVCEDNEQAARRFSRNSRIRPKARTRTAADSAHWGGHSRKDAARSEGIGG
ncbi:hypothetical protein, partial [endosymbiont of Lamellibrachia barhami]|uniref:hypothetical protein n=1 Tax=endosymbiont of Lamellibrachia barhami TaxID=205975 RepID=UPI001C4D1A66